MAYSFIGKPISLISHSDVRYRGILAGIDPANSTIQLSNVYSMGTETRKPPTEFIPPVQEPYQYIIFRASEVKDLAVDEPTPRRSVHDDPAVVGASAPGAPQYSYGTEYLHPAQAPAPAQVPAPPPVSSPAPAPATAPPPTIIQPPASAQGSPLPPPLQPSVLVVEAPRPALNVHPASGVPSSGTRVNSVQSAAASLEIVERALVDLRNAPNTASNNTSRRRREHPESKLTVPDTEFDFQAGLKIFDKYTMATKKSEADNNDETKVEESKPAYDPTASFFDNFSEADRRRGEERNKNIQTFGVPGGSGGMGRDKGRGRGRRGPRRNGR